MSTAAQDWLRTAPAGLAAMIRRMTWHSKVNWNAPDYIEAGEFGDDDEGKPKGDGREITERLEDVEAVSSLKSGYLNEPDGCRFHGLLIDLDVPAWLVPSSTQGHGHLYVDLHLNEDKLWPFLEAAAEIGLVEEGYVRACKSRGMTSLRAPWVRKGEERLPGTPEGRCRMTRHDHTARDDSATYRADLERAEGERASDWRSELPVRPAHDLCEFDPSDAEGLE